MEEEIHEQHEMRRDLEWYLGIIRRRHLHFCIALFVGWLVVWSASWVFPPIYKSNTLILVEQPTMPKSYVEPNVSDNLQDRMQSITQQILSRTHLLAIIQKFDLYNRTNGLRSADDKIALMRKDIDIELVRDAQHTKISAFRIYYSAHDPHVAQLVTSELTDLFIRENLETRQQQSEDTTKFLEEQLTSARASLADQEGKVREFQAQHEGKLPSQQASNLQILSGLQSQLQNEQDALNTARQQRVYYQAMIDQYSSSRGSSDLVSSGEDVSPLENVDLELTKLRARLTDLRSRYTDRHPDVLSLQDQISATEKMKQRLIADTKRSSSGTNQQGLAGKENARSNPLLAQLQGQLESNRLEIVNREESIASLKSRIGEYQGRLNAAPMTEQQLAELTRGYDQSKSNYDDLLKKKSGSEMATSMERMQQGERFTILDPPSLPSRPDFPNRLKFSGFALVAGLCLGIGVVAAFEFFDDRLRSEREIRALLPLVVIWDIPAVESEQDIKIYKAKRFVGWATEMFAAVLILAGSAYSYFFG